MPEVPALDEPMPLEDGSKGPKPEDDEDGSDAFEPGGPVGTAQGALDFMRANLGLGEDPPDSNRNFISERFFEAAGSPKELRPGAFAWCAATVSMALNTAWGDPLKWRVPGVGATYRSGTAYVPSLRQFFITAHRFDDKPLVGDVAIFGPFVPGEVEQGFHTGLVEEVLGDGTVVTLEGNAGNALRRLRHSRDNILGFGHPPYSNEEDPFMSLSPEQQEALLLLTKATNEAVGRLEVAVRDQTVGLQSQVSVLSAKIDQLGNR